MQTGTVVFQQTQPGTPKINKNMSVSVFLNRTILFIFLLVERAKCLGIMACLVEYPKYRLIRFSFQGLEACLVSTWLCHTSEVTRCGLGSEAQPVAPSSQSSVHLLLLLLDGAMLPKSRETLEEEEHSSAQSTH